jgi:hypothetical protein
MLLARYTHLRGIVRNMCFKIFYNNHNTILESREMGLHDRIEIIENPKNSGLKKDDNVTFNFI